MVYHLYPLPPSLKPCESIDTTDTRYLNQTHAPLVNLFKKAFHIELYNEKWLNKLILTSVPPTTYNHDTIQFPDKSPLTFPSVSELHNETNTCSPKTLLATENYSLSPPPSPLTLHNSLTNSGCLFFFRYFPENTLKVCWFLVQINHVETTFFNMNSKRTGDYHVTFISRYLKDCQF